MSVFDSLNPFTDEKNFLSSIIYLYLPLTLLAIGVAIILVTRLSTGVVPINVLFATIGVLLGMAFYSMLDMYQTNEHKNVKSAGFYGLMVGLFGLIIGIVKVVSEKRSGMSSQSYRQQQPY